MSNSKHPLDDLMRQHPERVKQVTNMLVESPYFYREDNEECFLYLRRHMEEFRRFFEQYFDWQLIMDMKCARVYKDKWYNEAIPKRSRMQFNFSRRDECIAFMLLLRFFEHQLEEQSLTVESQISPRFRFGDLLDYTQAGFLELGFDPNKYTLEHVRANILREMMPVLEQYRFIQKIQPDPGMRVRSEDVIYEARPALYHYNAGILRNPLTEDNDSAADDGEPVTPPERDNTNHDKSTESPEEAADETATEA
jgi:hypothetical protein